MGVKCLFALALRLFEPVLLTQLLCLPPLSHMDDQPHLSEQVIQMLFAHLNRAKRSVPLAAFAWARHGLHVLNHHVHQWKHSLQLHDHSGLGFPSTARRRRYSCLSLEAIVKPLWSAPLALSSCPPHGSAGLDGLLDVIGCFHHEVEHGLLRANYTVALELTAWINSHDKKLIVRFLFVAQLHVEQSELISLWPGFALLE